MFKNYIESIQNVEIFGIIGLLIFSLFFIVVTVWLIRMDKKYIDKMKNLPLEPDSFELPGKANDFKNLTGVKNEE